MKPKTYRHLLWLSLVLVFSLMSLNCKQNSTTPQVDDLTRPVIWINTSEITFAASETGGNVESQTIEIKNNGVNPLSYTIEDDVDWLQVEPMSGTSSGETVEHTVSIDKTGLAAQKEPYVGTITVNSPESYNNPQTVEVSLSLSKEPPPRIWIDPKNITFTTQVNGADPPSQKISIRNDGKGTLRYEISSDKSWISVSPNAGKCSENSKSHTVKALASGLASGEHTATLTVRDPNATNSPKKINVTLEIAKEPLPRIWVSSKNVSFSMAAGGSNPAPKNIKIKNDGGGTLKYDLISDANWLSVSPSQGTSAGGEKKHRLSVNATGLNSGNHNAYITIRDNNASNSPQKVRVTLKITTTSTDNKIWISCSPNSAAKGTIVEVPVSIKGNQNEIKVFGLELHFDPNMFQYHRTTSSNLTSGWAAVDGNEISSGVIKVGGFAGSASGIPVGSKGGIAVIKLKVTGDSYSNGKQSELRIGSYTDAIVGMKPEPAKTNFTLIK